MQIKISVECFFSATPLFSFASPSSLLFFLLLFPTQLSVIKQICPVVVIGRIFLDEISKTYLVLESQLRLFTLLMLNLQITQIRRKDIFVIRDMAEPERPGLRDTPRGKESVFSLVVRVSVLRRQGSNFFFFFTFNMYVF